MFVQGFEMNQWWLSTIKEGHVELQAPLLKV